MGEFVQGEYAEASDFEYFATAFAGAICVMLADSDAAVDGVVQPYRALRYLKEHSTNALYTALARVPASR